jgi:two-component system response regulator YcbB
MNIFIIEDDPAVINILSRIIKERSLGNLLGSAADGLDGAAQLSQLQPDIVLVDLLMPGKDGLTLVKELKPRFPAMQFVMLSQVSDKRMVEKAYRYGVEYYIQKPVNALEVESILRKVTERLEINRALQHLQQILPGNQTSPAPAAGPQHKIKNALQKLGILGQVGSEDIIAVVMHLLESKENINDVTLKELCSRLSDSPKSMEQRIRRAATGGMINIANLGLEDYMNETFTEYANSLYSFEQVKKEMDFARGLTQQRGTVNLKQFLQGLVFIAER